MPYSIKNYSGTRTYTVDDSAIDSNDLDINLIGQKTIGYGNALNTNFVYLLENFSKSIAPTNPVEGQLWWNKGSQKLFIYNAAGSFVSLFDTVQSTMTIGNVQIQSSAITGQNTNANLDISANGLGFVTIPKLGLTGTTLNKMLYVDATGTVATSAASYNVGSDTITAAYLTASTGISGTLTTPTQTNITSVGTLTDLTTTGIIKSNGNIVAAATTASTNSTTGSLVVKGGAGIAGDIYCAGTIYGTVNGSITVNRINNTPIGDITPASGGFTTLTATGTANFAGTVTAATVTATTIGNSATALSGTTLSLGGNQVNSYKLSVTNGSLGTTANSQILGQTLLCTSSNADYLEISNTRNQAGGADWTTAGWRLQEKIDATWMGYIQFNTGSGPYNNLGGISFGSGTSTAGPNAVPERIRIDANGHFIPVVTGTYNLGSSTLKWNNIYGQASSAIYADLAENYEADRSYDSGTVVEFGGEFEITEATNNSTRVAGVISTNPGYLMNSEAKGNFILPVALTGRVPCKVIGPVFKGDMIVSAGDGYGIASSDPKVGTVIGKALANLAGGIGLIEVVVGRC